MLSFCDREICFKKRLRLDENALYTITQMLVLMQKYGTDVVIMCTYTCSRVMHLVELVCNYNNKNPPTCICCLPDYRQYSVFTNLRQYASRTILFPLKVR